jgi:hypothetical protein
LFKKTVEKCCIFFNQAKQREFHSVFYNPGSERCLPVVEQAMSQGVLVKPVSFKGLDNLCTRSEKTRGVHGGVCADVSKLFQKDVALSQQETVRVVERFSVSYFKVGCNCGGC